MLKKIAGCGGDVSCPTIYESDDNLVIQGYKLAADVRSALSLPDGEDAVTIPKHVLHEAAKHLNESAPV